jgi:hypothetical protein
MYIQFRLPQGAGGMAATHALAVIRDKLYNWAAKYEVEYRTKLFKYTLRVTFDSDDLYTLFGLTWVPDPKYPSWTDYQLVVDLNNKI